MMSKSLSQSTEGAFLALCIKLLESRTGLVLVLMLFGIQCFLLRLNYCGVGSGRLIEDLDGLRSRWETWMLVCVENVFLLVKSSAGSFYKD